MFLFLFHPDNNDNNSEGGEEGNEVCRLLLRDEDRSHTHTGTDGHARAEDLATGLLGDVETGSDLSRTSCK